MGAQLIEKLRGIIVKYPLPKIHNILTHFVLAMLQLKDHPRFVDEALYLSPFVRAQILKAARDTDQLIQDALARELFEIVQGIAVFPDLTAKEANEIFEYCRCAIPLNGDTLGKFLGEFFQCAVEPPRLPAFIDTPSLAIQAALLKVLSGLHDETFSLRPKESLPNEKILDAVADFYRRKGYSFLSRHEQSVAMEEPGTGKLVSVCVSNFGHEVRVSVQ